MAQKPDGSAAKTERVTFTKPAAERIANVVRTVEAGDRDSVGLTFGRVVSGAGSKLIRAATFTGSWNVGVSKAVTFKYGPTATATVVNLSWPITFVHSSPEDCLVGKEGTSWWLIVPVLEATSMSVMTSVSVAATLNTSSCEITVGTTANTTSVNILRLRGM